MCGEQKQYASSLGIMKRYYSHTVSMAWPSAGNKVIYRIKQLEAVHSTSALRGKDMVVDTAQARC